MKKPNNFLGVKVADMDVGTFAELWNKPILHLFSTKLHISRITPKGCLRVIDEVPVPQLDRGADF